MYFQSVLIISYILAKILQLSAVFELKQAIFIWKIG